MKNNPTDRMKDPFYAGLLFQIEHIICQADDDAKSKTIPLIDSLCRAPQALTERITKDDGTVDDRPLSTSDWLKALETVEDSVKTRKCSTPGSRTYLDFAHGFMAQARGAL
jgi:hypothetical protein